MPHHCPLRQRISPLRPFAFALTCLLGTPLSAEVVINELMYHAPHERNTVEPFAEEFIELRNTDAAEAVDLEGWSFTSGVSYTFEAITLPADSYLVVAADPDAFREKYPNVTAPIVGPWTGRLSNSSERIRLANAEGEQMDELTYSDDGDWALRRRGPLDSGHRGWIWETAADGQGSSLELINAAMSNRQGQNWAASQFEGGTPGSPNSVAATNIAPFITGVRHSPALPSSSDQVAIRAKLTDEETTGLSASLFFRRSTDPPGPFLEIPMKDDGRRQDELAGDGIFGASLPAHADGTVIEFYVQSSDGENSRTWPGPSDEEGNHNTNALYAVEDDPVTNDRAVYRVILSVGEEFEFAFSRFNRNSDAQMNATFIATSGEDSDIRYRAGLRRRGAGSRSGNPRTLRLNLPDDDQWDDVNALNLNARYTYLQIFGQKMFAASGLGGAKGRPVKLLINGIDQAESGSRMYGFYAHMEPQNGLAIDRQFPEDSAGNLYRKRRPDNELAYRDGEVGRYLSDGWDKATNSSDWDWSDLDGLLKAINDTDNEDYLANIREVMDVEQWMRWFAVMTLLNNGETNISNGADDDYYMYRGVVDPRFKLVPHDLDTIVGIGDGSRITNPENTIFDMIERGGNGRNDAIPSLETLMLHPEVLPRYYHHLRDLIQTSFSKSYFDGMVNQCLATIPANQRANVIEHLDERREYVLSIIDRPLSVTSSLPIEGGYSRTREGNLWVNGTFNSVDTARILINGEEATLNVRNGTWLFEEEEGLLPGINRVVVEALDSNDRIIGQTAHHIWYRANDGATQQLAGTLNSDVTLTAQNGPYLVSGDLTVPAGITLTIEAGTTLYFQGGVRMTVNGQLRAEGTKYRSIQLAYFPDNVAEWDGLYFANTEEDNRLVHVEQSFASGGDQSMDIDTARVTLDQVTWRGTTETIIEASNPRLMVTGCVFPATEGNEVIHGTSLDANSFFHIDGCYFNSPTGYNDVIDFSGGRRPGPIIYVTNNVFAGSTDDTLDFDGIDAHVEGNIFRNVHTDDPERASTSNAIATDGDAHVTIVRNVFDDIDYALLLKNDSDAVFENNVVLNAALGVFSFNEPLREVDAGSHVLVRGNIFANNAQTFSFADHLRGNGQAPAITASFNILPAEDHHYGEGNIVANPGFVDLEGGSYELLPNSPARGTGINGADMGPSVPRGALLTGAPRGESHQNTATLQVHIAGISGIENGDSFVSEYRWRLNGSAWSDPAEISEPIVLNGLPNGEHTVEAIAKDSAGFWHDEDNPVAVTWTVNAGISRLRINEVLADNQGVFENAGMYPDYVELINEGSQPLSLNGLFLTDDLSEPDRYEFPDMTLAGGERLLLFADLETELPGLHLGFAMSSRGEGVYLVGSDKETVIDSVEFGLQIPNASIGRTGSNGAWELNVPTPDGPNQRMGTGHPGALRVNEWLAVSSVRLCDDFIELYNPSASPIALGGLYLTDDPAADKLKHEIAPLTFIAAGGFQYFWADNDPEKGPGHLSIRLAQTAEWVGISWADGTVIDLVPYVAPTNDVSEGRFPDGSGTITTYALPTPGLPNAQGGLTTVESLNLIAITDVWSYDDSDTDLGTEWRDPDYDDDEWERGGGLLYRERSGLPAPKTTPITLGADTFYFRKEFEFNGDPAKTELILQTVIDDGVVIYLNGEELHRLRMDDPYDHGTRAEDSVGNARYEGPFNVPVDHLKQGRNVISAEVHQSSGGSTDVVFGLVLDAEVTTVESASEDYDRALVLFDSLRVTEVMYDPTDGSDLEFIELQNIGNETLDLTGVRLSDGVVFTFPEMTVDPGEYVLVVSDLAKFVAKYGAGLPIAGVYSGKLSNGGETIAVQLQEPYTALIQKFTYNNAWYPLTDGRGHSLELIDPSLPLETWDDPGAWRVGSFEGSPANAVFLTAGQDLEITMPSNALLNRASISGGWVPVLRWSMVSGPSDPTIFSPTTLSTAVRFTRPGTYVLRLTGTAAGFQLSDEVVITVNDTFAAWKDRHGVVGGPYDNDDGDELANILEYAFDRDPFLFDGSLAPVPTWDGRDVVVNYAVHPRKTDLRVVLEGAEALQNWDLVDTEFASGTPDHHIYRHVQDADFQRWFYRFAVELVEE